MAVRKERLAIYEHRRLRLGAGQDWNVLLGALGSPRLVICSKKATGAIDRLLVPARGTSGSVHREFKS